MEKRIHCRLCNKLYTPKNKYQDLCEECTPVRKDYEVEGIMRELQNKVVNNCECVKIV